MWTQPCLRTGGVLYAGISIQGQGIAERTCKTLDGGLRGLFHVRWDVRTGQALLLQDLIEFPHQIGHFCWIVLCEASSATTRLGEQVWICNFLTYGITRGKKFLSLWV